MPDETCIVTRSFKLRGAESLNDAGEFVGWASVYSTRDAYDDEVAPGCFAKSLADSATRPLLWSHDPRESIGLVELEETPRGLKMRGKLDMAVARAREIHSLMRNGVVRGASIGFVPVRYEPLKGGGMRFLEAKLLEVSLTVLPANELAQVTAVKSVSKETKDMENVKAVDDKVEGIAEELRGEIAGLKKEIAALDMRSRNAGGSSVHGAGLSFAGEVMQKWMEYKSTFESHGRLKFEVSAPVVTRVATRPGTLPAASSPRIGEAGFAPVSELVSAIPTLPISEASVVAIREKGTSNWLATPAAEGGLKQEAVAEFESELLEVKTLAVWVGVTKQLLSDISGAKSFIENRLQYGLLKKLEEQILLGSGSGENLRGLMVSAPSWTAPTSFTYDLAGGLLHVCTQIEQAGFRPGLIVLNPVDVLRLRLVRDSVGQYVRLPELPRVISCSSMAAGQFLVFDPSQVVLRVKEGVSIDVSESHSDFFVKNQIAIRCEMRAALVVYSPQALRKGVLTTSPAS
jgi:HK97 family phage prohead protease